MRHFQGLYFLHPCVYECLRVWKKAMNCILSKVISFFLFSMWCMIKRRINSERETVMSISQVEGFSWFHFSHPHCSVNWQFKPILFPFSRFVVLESEYFDVSTRNVMKILERLFPGQWTFWKYWRRVHSLIICCWRWSQNNGSIWWRDTNNLFQPEHLNPVSYTLKRPRICLFWASYCNVFYISGNKPQVVSILNEHIVHIFQNEHFCMDSIIIKNGHLLLVAHNIHFDRGRSMWYTKERGVSVHLPNA